MFDHLNKHLEAGIRLGDILMRLVPQLVCRVEDANGNEIPRVALDLRKHKLRSSGLKIKTSNNFSPFHPDEEIISGPFKFTCSFEDAEYCWAAMEGLGREGYTCRVTPPHSETIVCDGEESGIWDRFWRIYFEANGCGEEQRS